MGARRGGGYIVYYNQCLRFYMIYKVTMVFQLARIYPKTTHSCFREHKHSDLSGTQYP